MPTVITELLAHRTVQIALGIVGCILVGSVTYYLIESAPPTLSYVAATQGPIAQTITGMGEVAPIQNPNLSFAAGGRVTRVAVRVGDTVSAGSVLASLDTGVLSANLAAAQAVLAKLEAGPRAVDVAGQQTTLSSAQTTLPDTLRNAEAQAENAVAVTDPLFTSATTNPTLVGLIVNDFDSKQKVEQERRNLNTELTTWRAEAASGTTVASTITHLRSIEQYLDDLSADVNATKSLNSTDAATLLTYASAVNGARSTISGLVLSVTAANTAVTNAQNQLNLATAGARPEDIDAQRAQVDSIAAQLRLNEVIAPFAGKVASVNVKEGDVVSANTTAISLVPNGKFEVEVYVSEVEVTKLAQGDAADITLDAYGSSRIFPATVSLIDQAPSSPDTKSAPGYKVTLAFAEDDPAITLGMHANATIHGGQKESALIIPRSAIIENGAQTFVLKKTASGPVQVPVTIGLINNDSAEILSGLAAGDLVARVGSR